MEEETLRVRGETREARSEGSPGGVCQTDKRVGRRGRKSAGPPVTAVRAPLRGGQGGEEAAGAEEIHPGGVRPAPTEEGETEGRGCMARRA